MSGVGYTDSNAPAPAPPATNYASISTSPSHPQGQNGTRNGYAPAGSNEEPAPWVRFVRALGGAVLVALLAGLLIESIYLAAERRAWEKVHLPEGYDVPEGMSVYDCATGAKWNDMSPPDDVQGFQFQEEAVYPVPGYPGPRQPFPPRVYPYSANTTFEVPLGSGDDDDDSFLSFVSRGRWLSGNVNIIANFGQEKGKAKVEVVIRHLRHSTQHQVRACVIEKDGGGKGVGLFTPEYEWHWRGDARKRQVDYEINVYLPLRPHESVFIDRLTVDTPYTFVQLPSGPPMMGSSIRFGEVIVNGKNGGIHAGQVLNADRIYVNASDTVVTGNFHVKQALHVETTNANILAMVMAQHSAGSPHGPSVYLQTSNAAMEAQINLLPYTLLPSTPPHVPEYGITPHYEIFAGTSNSRLNVNIASGFVGDKIPTPTLDLNATTSNGSVSATVLHEYSGGYDLESVDFGTARLNLRCTKPVPIACSDGVTRDYPEITSKSHLKGELEWVPVKSIPGPGHGHRMEKVEGLKDKKSSVVLTAQNGNVMLTV